MLHKCLNRVVVTLNSSLGVIPKKNKPGKWHLIVDLSATQKASANVLCHLYKLEGHLSFLGIEIDSVSSVMHSEVI